MPSQALSCVIIAPESANVTTMREALASSQTFEISTWLRAFPDEAGLLRLLRLNAPDLLIVDFTDVSKALHAVAVLRHNAPRTEIVALCEENVTVLSTLLRAGVSDYVTPASCFEDIVDALKAQHEKLSARPDAPRAGGDIVSFLSAKPGSGASTISANVAYAASKAPGKSTLLADFDRSSGVMSFLFKLQPDRTLRDALDAFPGMEPEVWARIRSQVGSLDILPADLDATPGPIDNQRVSHLLQFTRRAYDLTCLDLPGQIDSVSVEALSECKRIYIVCTQELACQHLLLRKVERLRRSGLDKQMRLIVNRFLPRHVMTADRIADLVGVPVELTIANDYEAANGSLENGSLVKLDTNLGRSYKKLAEIILNDRIQTKQSKPGLLDFFTQAFAKSSAQSA